MQENTQLIDLTADVVSAFVGNNSIRAAELPDLIRTIHTSLSEILAPKAADEPAPELKPAVPIKKSVTDDFIISLEDGRKFKSMKRYLSLLGMTPDDYRAKWGLPRDYPMVAPGYAAKRSELARASGLGANRRAASQEAVEAAAPEPVDEAPAKKRGRPKKAA